MLGALEQGIEPSQQSVFTVLSEQQNKEIILKEIHTINNKQAIVEPERTSGLTTLIFFLQIF